MVVLRRSGRISRMERMKNEHTKKNNGDEREAGHHRHHREQKTTMVWPRQKDAIGENTKINYGMDTTGEKKKRTSKKNVDGRGTSSHDSKKFRTRAMTDRWVDGRMDIRADRRTGQMDRPKDR
jgi:hypothetical protein